MKKRFVISFLIICLLLLPISVYAEEVTVSVATLDTNIPFQYIPDKQKELDNTPEIGCKAAYIAEPYTGKVIYEKNAHEKMYPASTTKILTALVVIENCQLTEKTVVSQNAVDLIPEGYTNAKLQAGEELDVETLLYALLLPSANEAANVLAEHVSGSIEAFVELCNKRAKELGCETLHFTNTNGMHDENHYCSAYDLYLIAKECRKHDIFNQIVKAKSFTVPATNIYPRDDRFFRNTNQLLLPGTYYYAYCTGIKTGRTTPAGECLVASSSYNNLDLISVVLGGREKNGEGLNERFYDTKRLFEFVYNNYSIKPIAEYGDIIATINVGKATKDTSVLDAIVDTNISTIVPNDINKDNAYSSIVINNDIIAPIKQNQVLGQITYDADGLIYTANIIASHPVEKLPYDKYNSIIVSTIAVTLIVFVILLVILKGHRIQVLICGFIIIVVEGYCIFFIYMEGLDNSVTKVNYKIQPIQNTKNVE